jgi:predicted aconitase with swiveling domain
MSYKVKVIDPKSPLCGQILDGACIYYDIYHRGNGGPDLFQVTDKEGNEHRLLSTQIDVDHYEKQIRDEEVALLGADVGDTVIIERTGSGSYSCGFNADEPHVITKISSCGTVYFDNGKASMFRPGVRVIKKLEATAS